MKKQEDKFVREVNLIKKRAIVLAVAAVTLLIMTIVPLISAINPGNPVPAPTVPQESINWKNEVYLKLFGVQLPDLAANFYSLNDGVSGPGDLIEGSTVSGDFQATVFEYHEVDRNQLLSQITDPDVQNLIITRNYICGDVIANLASNLAEVKAVCWYMSFDDDINPGERINYLWIKFEDEDYQQPPESIRIQAVYVEEVGGMPDPPTYPLNRGTEVVNVTFKIPRCPPGKQMDQECLANEIAYNEEMLDWLEDWYNQTLAEINEDFDSQFNALQGEYIAHHGAALGSAFEGNLLLFGLHLAFADANFIDDYLDLRSQRQAAYDELENDFQTGLDVLKDAFYQNVLTNCCIER